MIKHLYFSLVLVLFATFVSCNSSDVAPSDKILKEQKVFNQSYGNHNRHVMDVFLPANRTDTTPFVLLIHGGAWVSGDKSMFWSLQDYLLTQGVASATINYRFASATVHYEELMADIRRAIDYCVDHADEWTFKTNKIAIGGHSAGGHMSLLYGYKFDEDNRITAIIDAAGTTELDNVDWFAFAEATGNMQNVYAMVGATYTQGEPLSERFTIASPIAGVKNVPTLILHGDKDEVVPYLQATRLRDKLKAQNYTHKLATINNGHHDLGLGNPETKDMIFKEIKNWIMTHVGN